MSWFGFLLRNLWRRPGRSTLTLLGITLAVATFVVLSDLSRGLDGAARSALDERGVDLVVVEHGMIDFFASSLPEELEDRIRKVPGVADVSAELGALVPVGDDQEAIAGGWRPDSFAWRAVPLVRGRMPTAGKQEVVLGDALAETLRADIGAEVTIGFSRLHVSGIASFRSALNRGMAVLPLADLQALLDRPGRVTVFQVQLAHADDPQAMASVRTAIMTLNPGLAVTATDEVLRDNKAMAILNVMANAIAMVALAMACLSVMNTLAMAVEERTRDIGILAAIGWSRTRVLALILSEGMLLAIAGGILGGLLGSAGLTALKLMVLPDVAVFDRSVTKQILLALIVALAVGTVGAFWPAWRASRVRPAAALRRE
jgi:putative ABC transport system permease protein